MARVVRAAAEREVGGAKERIEIAFLRTKLGAGAVSVPSARAMTQVTVAREEG